MCNSMNSREKTKSDNEALVIYDALKVFCEQTAPTGPGLT